MTTETQSTSRYLYLLLAAGATVFAVVILFYRWSFAGPLSSDPAAWGQFGDFLGGTLNPVFAYLSFTALVITLALQTEQLRLSRKQLELSQQELAETRKELERSANAQAATAISLGKQAEMAAASAQMEALSKAIQIVDARISKTSMPSKGASEGSAWEELHRSRLQLQAKLSLLVEKVHTSAA